MNCYTMLFKFGYSLSRYKVLQHINNYNALYSLKNTFQINVGFSLFFLTFILPGNNPIEIQNLFFKGVLAKTAE